MAEIKEKLKSLLMKVKEESEKVVLKLSIQKTKIMASGPISSWQIDGETMETVTDFIFLGSKVTADGDCSPEIKRCLLLGRKVTTILDSVWKSRDITLSTKIPIVKTMIFSSSHVQIWELDHKEDWALKNCCFQIVVLEKTLESPLDSKEINPVNPKGTVNPKGNQPWIFTGKTDAKASASILGHLIQRADSLEKIAKLEKIEGRRRRGWQRIKWLDSITHSIEMNLSKLWEIVEDRRGWHATVHGGLKELYTS